MKLTRWKDIRLFAVDECFSDSIAPSDRPFIYLTNNSCNTLSSFPQIKRSKKQRRRTVSRMRRKRRKMKVRKKERKKKKLQLEPQHGWLLAGKLKGNLNVI